MEGDPMSVAVRNRPLFFLALLSVMLILLSPVSGFSQGYSINAGKKAVLNQPMHVRCGPGRAYTDLGTYFDSGTNISTLTSARDGNGNCWIQVEFSAQGGLRRGYAPADCLSLEPGSLPSESSIGQYTVSQDCSGRFGPGANYASQNVTAFAGTAVTVFAFENNYALIEFRTENGNLIRTWIPRSVL